MRSIAAPIRRHRSAALSPPSRPELPNLDELLALRREVGIVHQLPGRIRLRLGPAILQRAAASGLDAEQARAWLKAVPGIRNVRVNSLAASMVIEYDPATLDPRWWERLILGEDDEALGLVMRLLSRMTVPPIP
jgi:hypothetical protein